MQKQLPAKDPKVGTLHLKLGLGYYLLFRFAEALKQYQLALFSLTNTPQ